MRSPFMSSYYGCRMMIQNLPDALLFVERTTLIIDRHAHAVDEASNDATGRKGVVAQLGCIEQPDGNGFRQGGGISQRIGDARRRKLRNRIEEQMRLFDQLRCPRAPPDPPSYRVDRAAHFR